MAVKTIFLMRLVLNPDQEALPTRLNSVRPRLIARERYILSTHRRIRLRFSLQARLQSVCGDIEVIIHLETQPQLRRRANVARQPKRGIHSHATLAQYDLVDPARRDADVQPFVPRSIP